MPVSNGIFSKPIRLKEDLANFFGLSANLGNIVVNGSINMWSKHKPMDINQVSSLTDEQFAGTDGLYGLRLYDTNNESWVNSSISVNANNISALDAYKWSYVRPTQRYRMLDFDDYCHSSTPFMYFLMPSSYNINVNSGVQVFTPKIVCNYFDPGQNASGKEITIYDIAESHKYTSSAAYEFGSYFYPAIIVLDPSTNKYTVFKEQFPVADFSGECDIQVVCDSASSTGVIGPGNYMCYMVFISSDNQYMLPMPTYNNATYSSFNLNVVNTTGGNYGTFTASIEKIGAGINDISLSAYDIRETSSYTRYWNDASYYDSDDGGNSITLVNYSNVIFKLKITNTDSIRQSLIYRDYIQVTVGGERVAFSSQLETETSPIIGGTGNSFYVGVGQSVTIYVIIRKQYALQTYSDVSFSYNGAFLTDFEFASIINTN